MLNKYAVNIGDKALPINTSAKTLVAGYSPTGVRNTARTLNIVDKALEEQLLKKDSEFFPCSPH